MIFFKKTFQMGNMKFHRFLRIFYETNRLDENGEETEKFFAIIPGKKEEESDPAA